MNSQRGEKERGCISYDMLRNCVSHQSHTKVSNNRLWLPRNYRHSGHTVCQHFGLSNSPRDAPDYVMPTREGAGVAAVELFDKSIRFCAARETLMKVERRRLATLAALWPRPGHTAPLGVDYSRYGCGYGYGYRYDRV